MKIHAMMIVKNESDIIEYSLNSSLNWCDHIYILDNGSTDGTWELVNSLSHQDSRVVPYARFFGPYDNSLRSLMYSSFRKHSANGDWWVRLDADEVYIDNPKEFLHAIPSYCSCVWSLHYQYYLTHKEIDIIDTDTHDSTPPKMTASTLPRHFRVNGSEARFFKYRRRLSWPLSAPWPSHMGIVSRRRIRLKHFQYRSPQQIAIRLHDRQSAVKQGYPNFQYCLNVKWKDKIVSSQDLHHETDEASLLQAPADPSTPNHIDPAYIFALKGAMHGMGIWP
ncbi:glycosyltransferase [bacterium]|nr:glycosyltransferase [bacterium]